MSLRPWRRLGPPPPCVPHCRTMLLLVTLDPNVTPFFPSGLLTQKHQHTTTDARRRGLQQTPANWFSGHWPNGIENHNNLKGLQISGAVKNIQAWRYPIAVWAHRYLSLYASLFYMVHMHSWKPCHKLKLLYAKPIITCNSRICVPAYQKSALQTRK